VQNDGGLADRIAARLPADAVTVPNVEHPLLVWLDFRIEQCHGHLPREWGAAPLSPFKACKGLKALKMSKAGSVSILR
jgi:hypothetical protein